MVYVRLRRDWSRASGRVALDGSVEPQPRGAGPERHRPSLHPTMKQTLCCCRHWLGTGAVALAALSSPLGAAESSTAPATGTPPDETFVLTPFTVDASRDKGFVAASALTGG